MNGNYIAREREVLYSNIIFDLITNNYKLNSHRKTFRTYLSFSFCYSYLTLLIICNEIYIYIYPWTIEMLAAVVSNHISLRKSERQSGKIKIKYSFCISWRHNEWSVKPAISKEIDKRIGCKLVGSQRNCRTVPRALTIQLSTDYVHLLNPIVFFEKKTI